MSIKRWSQFLVEMWQPLLFWTGGLVVIGGVLFFRLGSLTPGLSPAEIASRSNSFNLGSVVDNPLNAPYKLILFGLMSLGHQREFSVRAVSAGFGLVIVGLFYYVISNWQERRVAILGTLLFATSAWFLHFARQGTPDITAALLLSSLAYGIWIRKTKRSVFVGLVGIALAAWLIYIPGLIWFVIIGGIWQSRQVGEHLKQTKLSIPIVIVLGAAILAPLTVAIARQPSLLKPLVGLPSANLANPYDLVRHIINIPFQIFFRGPNSPTTWLGRLPLLDIFTASMCLLGIYAYYMRRKLDRTKILAGSIVIGVLLVGLRGSLSIIVLAPFIYILVTAGVAYLLKQWFDVFPRNPLARSVGLGIVTIAVALSCYYNLRQYFVAWRGAPATKQAYQRRI